MIDPILLGCLVLVVSSLVLTGVMLWLGGPSEMYSMVVVAALLLTAIVVYINNKMKSFHRERNKKDEL